MLPYPKKVKSSSATDSRLTLPVRPHTGVSETVPSKEVSPTTTAVSRHSPESQDTWATCNIEESEAFWGRTGTRTSCTREEHTCCEIVGSSTDAVAETEATYNIAERTAAELISSNAGDRASVCTQDSSDKDIMDSVAEAVYSTAGNRLEDAELQMELSVQSTDDFVKHNTFVAHADSDSEENISSTTGYLCCSDTDFDVSCTTNISQPCERLGSHAEDDMIVDVTSKCDADDICTDELCVDNDSAADTYVVDDTEDSDVDENFIASLPSWQTVMKRDPFPMKERLLLSLEEVTSSTTENILSCDIDVVRLAEASRKTDFKYRGNM